MPTLRRDESHRQLGFSEAVDWHVVFAAPVPQPGLDLKHDSQGLDLGTVYSDGAVQKVCVQLVGSDRYQTGNIVLMNRQAPAGEYLADLVGVVLDDLPSHSTTIAYLRSVATSAARNYGCLSTKQPLRIGTYDRDQAGTTPLITPATNEAAPAQ